MSTLAFIDVNRQKNDETNITTYDYRVFIFTKKGKDITFLKETSLTEQDIKSVDTFYINLSSDLIDLRVIKLPSIDEQKAKQIVPFELEGKILLKREDLIFDIIKISNDGDTLVVYTDKNELYKILQPLKQLGIIAQTITSIHIRKISEEGFSILNYDMTNNRIESPDEKIDLFKKEIISPIILLKDKWIRGDEIKVAILNPLLKIGLLLLIVITLWFAFTTYSNVLITTEMKNSITSHYKTLFPDEKKITDEVYQLRSKIKVLEEKADAIGGIDALNILKNLSEAKTEGILFQEISLEKDVIKLKGEASKVDDVERFKNSIKWAKNVVVSDINQAEGGKYNFKATIKI